MKHIALALIALAGFPFQASAAVPEFSVSSVANRGVVTVHILNRYTEAATAWVAVCEGQAAGKWIDEAHWVDQGLSVDPKPLEPGREIVYRVSPLANGPDWAADACGNFHVVAALFADGKVSGDPAWLREISLERRKASRDIVTVTGILRKAIAAKTDRAQVVRILLDWQNERLSAPREGQPTPGSGENDTWSTYAIGPGHPRQPARPHYRLFANETVAWATVWLIQQKNKDFSETIGILSQWQTRLTKPLQKRIAQLA